MAIASTVRGLRPTRSKPAAGRRTTAAGELADEGSARLHRDAPIPRILRSPMFRDQPLTVVGRAVAAREHEVGPLGSLREDGASRPDGEGVVLRADRERPGALGGLEAQPGGDGLLSALKGHWRGSWIMLN